MSLKFCLIGHFALLFLSAPTKDRLFVYRDAVLGNGSLSGIFGILMEMQVWAGAFEVQLKHLQNRAITICTTFVDAVCSLCALDYISLHNGKAAA